ncbi:MAG: hypothetical protein ACFFD4_03995 [Candidatus Odinarchaeota archaeon]
MAEAGMNSNPVTGVAASTGSNRTKRVCKSIADGHAIFYTRLTALVLIKQTSLGPETLGDKLPFPGSYRDLLNLSCYYSMALGQGNHYHEGLYGPLPALGTEYRSLLYSVLVKDEGQKDPRMDKKNYLVLCFFYHEKLEEAVSKSRIELEKALRSFFANNCILDCIEGNWEVLKTMIQNYIYCTDVCMKNSIGELNVKQVQIK